ncbi:MAG: protein kinase [Sulfurimicrobium sp.]|nr:protein kinase [Sulfurimicrobium sp.]
MVPETIDTRSSAGGNSADATRIAPVAIKYANHADPTRIATSPAADSEATRLAPNARRVDLETEGTRIRGIPAAPLTQTTEREIAERYQIGEKIGDRYEVLAIHRGTMGVVYGTFDHKEMLPRALKTLQQRYASDKGMQDLFAAEAMTWVKLEKHPFIVRAYLVQKFDAQPYVITEYIRGQENMGGDLRAWLGHPRLTLPIAVEMALQIAQGMQHANCKVPGLVHRDLKPANILVDERARAMVTDFGLVHADDTSAGTPATWRQNNGEQSRLMPAPISMPMDASSMRCSLGTGCTRRAEKLSGRSPI